MNIFCSRMLAAAAAVLSLSTLSLSARLQVAAAEHATSARPADQVWLINTRSAARCGTVDPADPRIAYSRFDGNGHWAASDRKTFVEGEGRSLPTVIFVHGNRTSRRLAVEDGWRVLRRIQRRGPFTQDAVPQGPLRLVIWSWPSDRIRGNNRQDVRVKAGYSDVQGLYLADCLREIEPDVPVTLVGYSFGARAITGALHLLGGGRLAGRQLPDVAPEDRPAPRTEPIRRAVLIAPAMGSDWLLPGRRNGLALSQVKRLLITQNDSDPVLRWYPLLSGGRGRGGEALGFVVGTLTRRLPKVEVLNVSCSVGREHEWGAYLRAPGLVNRLVEFVVP